MFLDGELRQVWALDRVTGDPHYLDDGDADRVRDLAKREWRCPVPGCEVQISTRGKSRRDHFFHVGSAPHASDGESEAHLGAKAMLAEWAKSRLPAGSHVREEETVKDPATALHRIADVMVTWPDDAKTAFEVEYKPFAAEDWSRKQADYDNKDIPCAWLLGHTKVKPARKPSWGGGDWSNVVKVPALARAFAESGRHVLVINPMTKHIGTLAGSSDFTLRVTRGNDIAWLSLDHIDDCDIDPALGIITPTMRRIAAAEEAERRAAEAARAAARKAAEAAAQRQAADRAAMERKQERWQKIEAENQARWDRSDLLKQVTERWGQVPDILAKQAHDTWGIHAHPAHWHTALYEHHVHDKPAGHRFTVNDCWTTLAREGIDKNWDWKKAFKALINYLDVLQKAGLITINRNERDRVTNIETRGYSIGDPQHVDPEQEQAACAQQAPPPGFIPRKQRIEQNRRAADAQWEEQQERLRNIDVLKANQTDRWERSEIRSLVADVHGGDIPSVIGWPGGAFLIAIDASPAHWHAHVYMRHVHGQPAGTPVTASAVIGTLHAAGIETPGQATAVLAAVDDYLHNLTKRGILARPGDDPLASGYVVVTDALRQATPPAASPPASPAEQMSMW